MKILIANRAEIACRIIRTLRALSIPSVAVYTAIDKNAPHVWLANEAVCLGDDPKAYLDANALLAAARSTGATAIHPGYGFLSQNPEFANACASAGVIFIGPSASAMAALGDKRAARAVAEASGVPVVPGARQCDTLDEAQRAADRIGYPLLLKAAGGGGGKGMRRVDNAAMLEESFHAARREALGAFADDRLLVEKYIYPARHVEVQILGDGRNAVALGERECSLQRRYQKIIEESPSTVVDPTLRHALCSAAVRLAEAVGYSGAGTVEFLVGPTGDFYFLEVNTRLQVEHPVTEWITGMDLVAAQVQLAHGGALPSATSLTHRGHAIEARLNAEDPATGFLPSVGPILGLSWPQQPFVRIDAGIEAGGEISPYYDSLIAKIIAWGETREQARCRLIAALKETTILGVVTNLSFLIDILETPWFAHAETFTTTIEQLTWSASPIPQCVTHFGEQWLKQGGRASATHSAASYAASDYFSPWQRLGGIRVGQGSIRDQGNSAHD